MVRAAGAREVHVRISCPPTISPCFYGVDTPRRAELIAATHTLEEIRTYLDADTLAYLSLEGLLAVDGRAARRATARRATPATTRWRSRATRRVPAAAAQPRSRRPRAEADDARTAGRTTASRSSRERSTEGRCRLAPQVTQHGLQASGVDIDAGNEAVRRIKGLARGTFTPGVLSDIGSLRRPVPPRPDGSDDPVLVSSADGVGTKLKVAFLADRHDTVGRGPRQPLRQRHPGAGRRAAVLPRLPRHRARSSPDVAAQVVDGIARGCRENGCALLGGETAEMPGFYADGEYDLAGFIVGVVDRDAHHRRRGGCGRATSLLGLPSDGPAHQRLLARPRDRLRAARADGRHAASPSSGRRSARRCCASHRSLPAALRPRRCWRGGAASRGSRTSPAAASPTTCRASCPPGTAARIDTRALARAAASSGTCAARGERARATTCTAPSTWASA